jgi:peptidoglycan hydrolase-like protein with peptidoglycan-binding domain
MARLWPGTRRARIASGGVAIAGAVLAVTWAGVSAFGSAGGSSSDHTAVPTATASVIRTDLVSRQQANGTLGYGGSYTVVNQLAPPTTTSSGGSGAKGKSSSGSASSSSSSGPQSTTSGTFTAVPAIGDTLSEGQQLYAIDGRPVPLLYGSVPLYRTLQTGVTDGPDVQQLEQDLVDLGFGDSSLTVDEKFTAATTAAVERWQAALGVNENGVVNTGEAVFLPGALRATNVRVALGSPAQVGAAVLDGTSTVHVVSVALDVSLQQLVHAGDAVVVDLPDGKTTLPGTVLNVSSVANPVTSIGPTGAVTSGSSSGAGGGASGGSNAQTSAANPGTANNAQPATVAVTIVLSNPDAAGRLDQAPVTVEITSQTAKGVLAVPVNALVALSDGGYAVNVAAGSLRTIVPVQLGLFAGDNVEVKGSGLREGMRVEVPAS